MALPGFAEAGSAQKNVIKFVFAPAAIKKRILHSELKAVFNANQ
jgi:hypothetical protein